MATTDAPILYERQASVAWISINRPERRNALDFEARRILGEAFERARADDDVAVVVLRGKGGAFSAGVDLSDDPADDRHVMMRNPQPLVTPLVAFPKPIIAAIDGPAVGGGFELALCADIRIASNRAFFALTEVRLGSLPGSGGTQRLFAAVPSAVAWRVLLSGDRLSAQRAYEVGLVSDLFDVAEFDEGVAEIVTRVAEAAPLSLRAATLAGRAGVAGAGDSGLALERTLWAFLSTTEDRAEGRAAFREKRDPEFRGK